MMSYDVIDLYLRKRRELKCCVMLILYKRKKRICTVLCKNLVENIKSYRFVCLSVFCINLSPSFNRLFTLAIKKGNGRKMKKCHSVMDAENISQSASERYESLHPFHNLLMSSQLSIQHHCRGCGQIYCSQCTSQSLVLPASKKMQRVCDKCFKDRTN